MQYKGGHVEGLRRNVKDSLFTYYFSDPKHALEMYKALFPEDKNVTAADIQIVTLTNVLAAGMYNDLGFLVKDRMIILVEAQSSYSENITLRLLFYIAGTYREFVEKSRSDIYGMKKVWIPKPEFFVVYTGREKTPDQIPDELCLSDLFALKFRSIIGDKPSNHAGLPPVFYIVLYSVFYPFWCVAKKFFNNGAVFGFPVCCDILHSVSCQASHRIHGVCHQNT